MSSIREELRNLIERIERDSNYRMSLTEAGTFAVTVLAQGISEIVAEITLERERERSRLN